jgi:Uma2 family endonuclease
MTKPANQTTLTLERFLELEREAVQKHEFVDGQMYAMAGASERHNLIVTNLLVALKLAARASTCRVMSSDMKVVVQEEPPISYYPDVVVICDKTDDDPYIKRKPCLIVEVLSESTQRFDENEKRWNYQRLESLKTYLIVHQDQKRIDVHRRTSSNEWTVEHYEADEITLECPNMVLKLEDIYESVGLL